MKEIITILILCLAPMVVLTQEQWVHICSRETKEVSCPEGATFEMIAVYNAYRELGCPDDSTDPVSVIANCSHKPRGNREDLIKMDIATRCNQTNACNITAFGLASYSICSRPKGSINVFQSYSYICQPGPSTAAPPTTPEPVTQSSAQVPVPKTPGPAEQRSSTEQPSYISCLEQSGNHSSAKDPDRKRCRFNITIVPLAAGAGGAVFLVIVLFIVTFCFWRNRGNQSIEKAQPRQEDVSYVNMSKVEENRKSAPRIKEENWNRPDVTATTFEADKADARYADSDPRGLYALPDKSFKRDMKTEAVVDRSDTESNQAETSLNTENLQTRVEISSDSAELSPNQHYAEISTGHTNTGYVIESSQYAEIPLDDITQPQPAAKRHVQFEENDNAANEDRDIPEDSVTLQRGRSKKEVPSVIYAEVNKSKPQE